jgi:site-specific recombinase XerD
MDPGQISRLFKALAIKADIDPNQISGHSTRIGAAQDLLVSGASIGQIMAKVGWSKVDTVMRYVGVNNIEAMNSPSVPQSERAVYRGPKNPITI